jgi:hypothetical protein
MSTVQNLLNQTGDPNAVPPVVAVCDSAMRAPGGGNVVWDPIGAPGSRGPVGSIVASGVQVASVGQFITPNLQITNMYLREPDPTLLYASSTIGEGQPVHSRTTSAGKAYDTIVAKLVIEFTVPSAVAGGKAVPHRIADVSVGISRTAPKSVAFCYTNRPVMAAHKDCANAATDKTLITSANDCHAIPNAADLCVYNYHVQGFDTSGNPICVCNITCASAKITHHLWVRSSNDPTLVPDACSANTTDPGPLYNGVQCNPTAPAVQECLDTYTMTNSGGCGAAEGLSNGPPIQCITYKCMPAP